MLGLVLIERGIPLHVGAHARRTIVVAAAIIVAHFLMQAVALTYTTASRTGWIVAVSPLVIAVLATRWLGEHVRARLWDGVGLATAGHALLVSDGDPRSFEGIRSLGDGLILGSAFTWAAYTLGTPDLSRRLNPLVVTFWVYEPLPLLCAAWIALDADLMAGPDMAPRGLAALLFLGIPGTLAQWFWQIGIARLGAARAGVFLYLEPLVTTGLAIPLLGETLGVAGLAGGVLVLAGVAWAERE